MKPCHFYSNHLSPSLFLCKWSEGAGGGGSLTSARPLRCLHLFKTSHIRPPAEISRHLNQRHTTVSQFSPLSSSVTRSAALLSLDQTVFLYQLHTPSLSLESSSYRFKTRHYRHSREQISKILILGFILLLFIYLCLDFNCNIFNRCSCTLAAHTKTYFYSCLYSEGFLRGLSIYHWPDYVLALYLLASIDFNYSIFKMSFFLHISTYTKLNRFLLKSLCMYHLTGFIIALYLFAYYTIYIFKRRFSLLQQHLHAPNLSFIPICIQKGVFYSGVIRLKLSNS